MNVNIEKCIHRGDILRATRTDNAACGCYLANGRFGAVFCSLGLNLDPAWQDAHPEAGRSQFTHMAHWGRFHFHSEATDADTSADYILPLLRVYWEGEPAALSDYRQRQSFFDGTLETAFTAAGGPAVRVTCWFDSVEKDVAGILVDVEGDASLLPAIRVCAVSRFIPYPCLYRSPEAQQSALAREGDAWRMAIGCEAAANHRASQVYIHRTEPVKIRTVEKHPK